VTGRGDGEGARKWQGHSTILQQSKEYSHSDPLSPPNSHTVMHGVKTDLPDISHLETAKKGIPVSSARPSAGPPSSRSNPSSAKPSPTARPSPTGKASAGPTGPVYPSYPAANAGYPSFPSASPSTAKPGAGGASPSEAGRAKELEREREKARARDEEKSRQERMQRGAKAVDHGLGGGAHKVVEASSKQVIIAQDRVVRKRRPPQKSIFSSPVEFVARDRDCTLRHTPPYTENPVPYTVNPEPSTQSLPP